MSDFQALIEAVLDTTTVEKQLNGLKNQKIELDIEIKKDKEKQLASTIEKSLSATKIDTKKMSKQLADSFNISDKSIVKKLQSQLDSMMSSLANTFNGKRLDLSQATGFYDGIDDMAKTVSQNANIIKSKMGIYDDFYNYFKNKKIYVSDNLKKSLGDSQYKDLLQNNVGKIVRDASKGVAIDSIWDEMISMFPQHFADSITNQADQIVRAFDVLKAARADIDSIIPASQFNPDQIFATTESAYNQIVSMAGNLKSVLQQNLSTAMEMDKTTLDLNVQINTDKIISDVRSALQSATSAGDDPIDIHLNLNEEDIISSMRSALSRLDVGNEPVQVDIQINRQSIQDDINSVLSELDLPIHFNIDAAELESDIRNAVNSITDIEIDLHINTDHVRSQMDDVSDGLNMGGIDTAGAHELEGILNGINAAGRQGQSVFQSFGSTLQEAFATFTVANILQDSIYKVIDSGEKAIETVKELSDVSLSLQMATGESSDTIKNMMTQYNQMGQELGSLTKNVAEGADTWLRQGKSAEEANTLIKDTMVLSKLSNLDAADSAEYLTSAMMGYKVAVEDVSGIVDKLGSIDMASATDAGGLAEGMSKVAVTANQAGVSMDKLLSYLATIGEISQDGMSEVGNSIKTIFNRMSDIKGGKLELVDEDGTTELLSDVELTLSKVGIDLRKTVTEYNSYSDVLDNLAAKWNTLNQAQQNALGKAFAGQRQGNRFRILMENYDKVMKYASISENSAGSAEEKFQFYLDSLEGKTNSLKASLEGLATSTISDELYAGVLDTAKAMTDLTTQTGILKGALAGLGTGGALFAFSTLSSWIQGAVQEFANLDAAMNISNAGATEESFRQLMGLTQGLSRSQTQLVMSNTMLTESQRMAILTNQGLSNAEAQAALASMGLASAEGVTATATMTLSGSLKGLYSTLMSNPIVAVAMGVTAAVTAFSSYKNAVQENVNAAKEAGNAWSEQNNNISENISKITELKNALDSGSLTEQEATNAKSELLSIQQSLTDSYGNQISKIDLVNGKLEEQIALLNQVSEAEANQYLNENKKGIDKAEKEMTKERNLYLGSFSDNGSDVSNATKDVLQKYKDRGISVTPGTDGITAQIQFTGDATQAKETLNDLMADIRKVTDTYGENDEINLLNSNMSSQLKTVNEVLNNYQDIYNQAKTAQLMVDSKSYGALGTEGKKASDWMNDYTQAVQSYNDAIASGDSRQIEDAKLKFDDVDKSIQVLLKDQNGLGQYSNIFSDIKNQAGSATVAVNELSNATSATLSTEGTTFSAVKMAQESENKGDTYDSMMSIAEKVKKLRKSGDIGTDDFKKFAELISPTGADDVENFDENIGKFERYFTKDNSGLTNFLEDLSKKTNESGEALAKFNEQTGEWTYNIDDLEQAAQKMGMGFEPFMAIFGKLEDKGFHNDFFSTQEEGINHLASLYSELGTAEQELADLERNNPGNSTAINAKKKEIEELKDRIDSTTDSLKKLLDKDISDYEEEDKAAKTGLQAQIDQFNKNKDKLSDAAKKRILNDIQTAGTQYGYDNIGFDIEGNLVLDTTLAEKSIEEVKNVELPDKIVKLVGEDNATGILILWNTLQANDQFTSLTADDQATYLIGYWNSLTPEQQEAIIKGKDEATPLLNKIQNAKIDPKEFSVKAKDESTGILSKIKSWLDKIQGKTVTVTTKRHTVYSSSGGDAGTSGSDHYDSLKHNANGTLHPAHATGTNVALKKDEVSVINELGNEGLIRDGVLREIPGGLHLERLKRGDIILNHKQMEELKKKSYVTSNGGRGKLIGGAFSEGTLSSIKSIRTYATGSGGGKLSGSTSTSSSSSSSKTSSSKKSTKNDTRTKKGKTAWEQFEDWLSKLFDWIEVKTSRLERLTSKWMDKAENAIRYMDDGTIKSTKTIDKAFDTRRESLKKAISYNQQNITANQRGTAKYQEMANTVLSKAVKTGKVSKSSVSKIKAKVADGSINISDYKEETQKVITEYQKWYEKALDCKDAVEELREQQKDLYDDLYKIPIDRATAKVEKYQKALDRLSSTLDAISGGSAKDTYISNVESVANSNIAKAKKDYLNKRTDYLVEKEQVEKDLSSAKKSVTKDKSLMKNSQVKKAVKNGKKIDTSKIKDKNDKKKAQKYNDALDAKAKLKEKKQAALDAKAVYNATNSYYSEAKKTASSFKDKPEYEYQNYLIEEQLKIQKEIDKQNQTALRTAVNNEAKTAKAKASAVQAKKDATTNLKNSKVYKKLSASQKNAVEKGQTISEKGFSGKNLEEIRKYNKAIQEANKRTDAYNSALNALSEAEMNAAESTAELTKAQIEAEQTKFDNIKSYYDAQKSYQDSLNSQIEAQQSLKEAKGIKLNKSDYEGLIGNSQKQEALAREEVAKLQAQLDSSVKSGIIKEGSSEWIEMQSQINDAKVEIIDAQKAQIEWNNAIIEMELEKFENLLDLLDAISEYNDSLIDLKKATGDVITAEDFNRQIADRQEQIKALEEERSEVWDNYQKALADSEGAYGGKTADEWKQQYYELGTEINNVKQEVIDLQDELNNLELDKLARDLKKLSSAADRLEHSLNIKEAKGLSATVEDYEQLIANSKEQVANLEAQNAELRKQQEGLKEDSDKYQELQDKIEDNEAAIRDAEIAQIEWNNAIAEVPIQELERLLEVLKSIAEYNESIVNLKKASGEVVTEADYRQQIADREQQIAALEKQRAIAYQNYQEALNSEEKAVNGKTVEEWEAEYNSLGTEINNVKIEIEDLKDEMNSIELTKLSNELAVLSAEAERLNDAISMKEVRGASLNASDYNELIANSKQQVANLQAQNEELRRIQSGYEKGSEKYEELQRQIEDNEDAIRDAQRAQEEWNIAIQNLPLEKLERALELLDAIAEYNESLNDLKSAQGQDLTASDYEQQMADNNKKIQNLLDQRQEALNNYQQAMNSDDGTYGGKTAEEWQAEYNSLGAEINNTKIANEQLKDSMREDIEFRQFKRAAAETERLRTQLETLRAVIDDDDMYDDNGNLTSQGHSAIAIAQKELASYQKDIENANAKIARIKAMHGQDGYSEDEYLADLAEAENELLTAVQGEANARKEIKSIIQESVDLQLEAAQKLIDKYNDLLNVQKDLYDYQKSIKDLTKEISDLTKQEIMLKGDDSEENKAKVQQIKVSLEEAKENLQETEYEHYISEQQKMLDNLYDEYDKSLNESADRIVDELKAGSTEINVGNENLSTGILDNTTAITDNTTAITEGNTAISEGLVNVDESINNNFTDLQELLQSLMEGLGFSSDENTDTTNSIIENIANELSSQFGTEFADMNAVIQQLAERFGIDLNASSEEMAAKFKELADQYGINLDMNFEEITAKIKEWAEKYGVDLNVNFDEVISYLKSIAENLKDSGSNNPTSDSVEIDGYESETKSVNKDKYAWTQGNGTDYFLRTSDGAEFTPIENGDVILTPVGEGDVIFTPDMAKKLWEFAQTSYTPPVLDDSSFKKFSQALADNYTHANNINQTFHVEMSFPNVMDYKSFMKEFERDSKAYNLVGDWVNKQIGNGNKLVRRYY